MALTGIAFLYLLISLSFSLLTPAGETNDELDHVQYIEYIASHGSLPRINIANGDESHQPPLYYLVADGWQELLQIPPFHLELPGASLGDTSKPRLGLSHAYTATQHRDAIYVHELRILSVLFGLGTVLLTYAAGKLATSQRSVGLAAALFVAVFPKEDVLSSSVTNDALVIFLGSLSLVLLLLWLRSAPTNPRRHFWLAIFLGISLGAAALTKFTALPLVGIFLIIMIGVSILKSRSINGGFYFDAVLTLGGFFAVAGWWFVRNHHLYGQFLAERASNAYLKAWNPALIAPVSWLNSQRFLHFVPRVLSASVWYDGDWNQFLLPQWLSLFLSALAICCVAILTYDVVRNRGGSLLRLPVASTVFGALLAGLVALLVVAKDTTQAEGRITYIGLSAAAVVLVLGIARVGRRGSLIWAIGLLAWPLLLLGVDIYVFIHYVFPTRGL